MDGQKENERLEDPKIQEFRIILSEENWYNLGPADAFKEPPLREITIDGKQIALSFQNGEFGAVDNFCNHVGGPMVNTLYVHGIIGNFIEKQELENPDLKRIKCLNMNSN